jgi:hypothetical protein
MNEALEGWKRPTNRFKRFKFKGNHGLEQLHGKRLHSTQSVQQASCAFKIG